VAGCHGKIAKTAKILGPERSNGESGKGQNRSFGHRSGSFGKAPKSKRMADRLAMSQKCQMPASSAYG
jgi:hypothetical protein